MVTLGGNGKRSGHVRVPPEDRGSCKIVYVQAGRSEVFFSSLFYRACGGFSTHSSFFMDRSKSYDWMRTTAWAQKVLVQCERERTTCRRG